jgi:hypothetical protein
MDPMKLLSDEFDKRLIHILNNGREIMTKDGELLHVEATSADLNIIRQRLKDCGVSVAPTEENPVGSIIESMKAKGHIFKTNITKLTPGEIGDDDLPLTLINSHESSNRTRSKVEDAQRRRKG